MREKVKITNVVRLWADKIPEVKRWLAKLQDKTGNAFYFYRFCQWCGKTPAELLALKNDPANKDAEYLLDDFIAKDIVVDEDKLSNAVKFHMVTAVKSFFKHNYVDLAKASGAMTLEKVKPTYKPKKEDLRKLWNWTMNPRDKAFISFTNSTAIAKETLSRLKWKHIEENWENVDLPCINIPSELLKGHGHGRYKDVRQITFLTPEAKRDLFNYREWIEKRMKRKLTPEDNVFLEVQVPYQPIKYKRLGKLIWDLKQNTGIPFSWHDARRYVNTVMEEIRMPPNWARKIRGRKVRGEEAPYSQPAIEQLRQKFREAVPLLEFTSEKAEVNESERRKQMILDMARMLPNMTEEKLAHLQNTLSNVRTEKEIDGALRNIMVLTRPKKEERKGLENPMRNAEKESEDCQRIVSESELEEWLNKGFRFVATLPSGKILLSNE